MECATTQEEVEIERAPDATTKEEVEIENPPEYSFWNVLRPRRKMRLKVSRIRTLFGICFSQGRSRD